MRVSPIDPREIRYIKLGRGGVWAERSLEKGEIHFGYKSVPHELCLAGDWDTVAALMVERDGKSPGKAKDMTREVMEFYSQGSDCLWITFAHGHLWWAFADLEVIWLGPEEEGQGARMRRTLDGWHKTDIRGELLNTDSLSSRLTQVAAYRQTLCRVKPEAYLLRRINGEEEPVVAEARRIRSQMIAVAVQMISSLHWADFETLVDLIFTRSGWQRTSMLGGTQKDVDLILEQPTTGERAFVQVKSKADQSVLDDYLERYRAVGSFDRMFFVCHSPKGSLNIGNDSHLHLWTGAELASATVKAGLFDWLVERSA